MSATEQRQAVERRLSHTAVVDAYYDTVNEFYLRGWGESFHFAPRFAGESFRESLARQEHYVAHRLGLERGMRVLDAGCGVGGPMRSIARFVGVEVTGITINAQQATLGERFNRRTGLSDRVRLVQGDFADLPFHDGVFDAAYSIGALCHAPDRSVVCAEIFRVLRPDARVVVLEWCLTDRFDIGHPEHAQLKLAMEESMALADLTGPGPVHEALESAGFQVLESYDAIERPNQEVPWYRPLTSDERGLRGALITPLGRRLTLGALCVLERLRGVRKGSADAQRVLMRSGDALARSGQLGIFTPAQFFLARKPPAPAHT